jgi:hypothetical protein
MLTSLFLSLYVSAFTCGAAFHVMTSQVKPILGVRNTTSSAGFGSLVQTYIAIGMPVIDIQQNQNNNLS